MTEREYIDWLRQQRKEGSTLNLEDLASSVRALADELYARDTHFLFELVQNAEDNDYESTRIPCLSFQVCQQKIEGYFGPVLIVRNNETGFREEHVQGICRSGKSTKKKVQGYIGEKGIGFKSVFRITQCPYIFSNRFQFCLPDHDEETGLAYIVPRWIEDRPAWIIAAETTIVLPLNKGEDTVQKVVDALRSFAPETILFLEKLSTIEISIDLPQQKYDAIIEKHVDSTPSQESQRVELTYLIRSGGGDEEYDSFHYWVTKVEYRRPADIHHDKRVGIDSRPVSVAIPLGSNARRGMLFAYLPVWEETGLPFLVNGDFLLVSSREGIREDEAWNKWLRDCIGETFSKSFLALVNCPDVALTERLLAYGSIPLESHRPFLSPIIDTIQRVLADHECVMVMPDNAPALPSNARLSDENLRRVLQATGLLPNYLCAQIRLVLPELEAYKRQLAALGIKELSSSEIVSILQDEDWLIDHDLQWFVDLFAHLRSQRLEAAALRRLKVVPVTSDDGQSWRLSCDQEQPIYFHCSEADKDALSRVPNWQNELVSIAFLDADFLSVSFVQLRAVGSKNGQK